MYLNRVRRQGTILVGVACLIGSLSPLALTPSVPFSISADVSALREGKNEDALRICDELLRTDPQSYKVWTLRTVALEQLRQSREALKAYQHALNVAPES
jgi:tetratricopeptide (TPR) repeat protein